MLAGDAGRGPVPGATLPALPWCGTLAWWHCLPWAGSRLLAQHLLFLVKNSLGVRQRGAGVFALSASTLLSVVMLWW